MKAKFILLCLCLFAGINASAYDAKINGIYYNFSEDNAAVTYLNYWWSSSSNENAYSGNIVIPESVIYNDKTYRVTKIDTYAFSDCTKLTSIVIPESVTAIGNKAFYNCNSLISIIVEKGNQRYDSRDNCNALIETASNNLIVGCQSTIIPDGIISIGEYAFYYCEGLISIIIPESVKSIGNNAFYNCNNMTSITIPDCVMEIGEFAFAYCTSLSSITIPESVTSIGEYAFSNCYFAKDAFINNSTQTSIDMWGAKLCNIETSDGLLINSLSVIKCRPWATSVIIPDNVTSIGENAFSNCKSLSSVTIPKSVTSIGEWAFSYCISLTSIDIPENITKICTRTFYMCEKLISISLPKNAITIKKNAFEETAWYNNQPDGLTYIGKIAYQYKGTMPKDTHISIEEGTLGTAEYAFSDCNNLTAITIPESMVTIGNKAFSGCKGLSKVTMESDSIASALLSSSKSWSTIFGNQVQEFIIGDAVKNIGDNAFYDCRNLTSVTIGKGLRSIGWRAFYRCNKLTSVHITDLTAWCNIYFDDNPLYYAHHLYLNGQEITNLVIPDDVTSIGCQAFSGCSITSVDIPESVTNIGKYAFSGCTALTSFTIPNSVTSIGEDAFSGCNNLTAVHITDLAAWCNISFGNNTANPLSCAHHLYLNEQEITDIVIPDGVTSIGDYAFTNCSELTSITIPNSMTSIGYFAFQECSALTAVHITDLAAWCNISFGNNTANPLSYAHHLYLNEREIIDIVIPDGVTSINDYAFINCNKLSSVDIPNSVTSIGNKAFSGCTGLNTLNIPENVTTIGNDAFFDCEGLTSITIPNSVLSVGLTAFSGCNNLSSITFRCQKIESWFSENKNITKIVIGNEVESISDKAFYNCSSLSSITIGNGVTSLGSEVFVGTPWYDNLPDGLLYIGKILYKYIGEMPEGTEIIINEGTVSIYASAFSGCNGLSSIIIPESMTDIGADAFSWCYGLTAITIPNSVISIGNNAFQNCIGLTFVTIGNNVTSIGKSAFSKCKSLTKVTIGKSLTNVGENAFLGCSSLTIVSINSKECGPWFRGLTSLKEVHLGDGVEVIASGAFTGCKELTSIVIPETVKYVLSGHSNSGGNNFEGTSLESVTFLGSPQIQFDNDHGWYAFYCPTLKSVYIYDLEAWCKIAFPFGNNPLRNEADLYLDDKKVIDLVIPDGVTEISAATFEGCQSIQTLTISQSVETIRNWAFADCTNLKSVWIPSSVTYIEESAFRNCLSLTDIYCFGNQMPQTEDKNVFNNVNLSELVLHVPDCSIEDYRSSYPWSQFGNIIALTDEDIDGIESIQNSKSKVQDDMYNLAGQRIGKPQRGLNIIGGKKMVIR